jgi:lysozyme
MFKTSINGQSIIKNHETIGGKPNLKAYLDTASIPTIGYGTTHYPNNSPVKMGDICTSEQAQQYFEHDLLATEIAVNSLVTYPLNQNQFDALVSLVYNIGIGNFKNSTLLKLLNLKTPIAAANHFTDWDKDHEHGILVENEGLLNRRKAEKELFLS